MRYAPAGGADLRHRNSVALITALRSAADPLTVSELAERTGLSRPTVDAVTGELSGGPVVRIGEATAGPATRGGRPARTVVFSPRSGCVAGVDVGARSLRVVVTDLAGAEVGRHEDRLPAGPVSDRIGFVRSGMSAALRTAGRTVRELRGVAVAVPGIVGSDQAITQSLAVPDWVGLPVRREFARSWRCPVALENDIKLAALAEHRIGDRGDDIAYVQLGRRISLALVLDGRIRQGAHRVAGELGSLRGMRWTSNSQRGNLRWRRAATAEQLFTAAAAGDRDATAEIAAFCAEVAPTLATVLLTVDPRLVVVGGGLSRAGATLLDPLRQAIHALLTTPQKPDVVRAVLGSEAGVHGALGLAFERWSAEINGLPGVAAPWPSWRPSDRTPSYA